VCCVNAFIASAVRRFWSPSPNHATVSGAAWATALKGRTGAATADAAIALALSFRNSFRFSVLPFDLDITPPPFLVRGLLFRSSFAASGGKSGWCGVVVWRDMRDMRAASDVQRRPGHKRRGVAAEIERRSRDL